MLLKKVTSIILAATLLFTVAACQKEEPVKKAAIGDDYVLKIGEVQGALCHAPLQVAMEKGYFDKAGINWERIDFGGSDIQAALGSGAIDCGFGLVGKFVQPIENGLNMKITAGIHTGCTKILVKPDSGINSIEDLKGKTIGVSSLAGSEAVTAKRALDSVGIDVSADSTEISFAVFSTADQPQALMNGAVDAIATPDPVATNAENEYGLTVLLDTAVTEPYASEYCCVCFVSTELAEKHPEIAKAFTDAMLKASAWVAENPLETAKIQIEGEYVAGNAEDNAKILESYKYIPSVQGGYDALYNVASDLHKIGILKSETDVDDLVNRSFVFFDGLPDSYTADGVAVTDSNKKDVPVKTSAKKGKEEEIADCCEDEALKVEEDCCEETIVVVEDSCCG